MDAEGGTTTSRRRFLGTAAGATGVALGAAVWGRGQAAAAVPPQGAAQPLPVGDKRGFVSGRFALNIGEANVGWLQDAEGGGAYAEVVDEKVGTDQVVRKHLGNVKWDDITLKMGLSMDKAVYDWIAASWTMNAQRKNGAIVAADYSYDVMQERQFFDGLLTEVGIPAADASSKEPGYLTVKITPAYTRTAQSSGKLQVGPSRQKVWLPSNFKLQIDGLDCSRVNKIDALTIKQSVVQYSSGSGRDYQNIPGSVEFPNLRITFASSTGRTWLDWYDVFLINGDNGPETEKTGSLTYLTPDLKGVLLTLNFFNMGIIRLEDGVFDPVDEPSAKMRAELYVEQMEFVIGGTTAPPSP